MVMKDKLVKTNHKGGYYLIKKISIAMFALACFTFAVAVPTYIIQNSQTKKQRGLAEENSVSETMEEQESESSESEYESYDD